MDLLLINRVLYLFVLTQINIYKWRYQLRKIFSFLIFLGCTSFAYAQNYPSMPIKLIVPYAPGGGTDISARLIAKYVSVGLGQPVVIENKPGAGTILGTAYVAKAPPDGYTLIYGSITHTIAPALYKQRVSYDPIKDFTPITQIATFPFILATTPSTNITSIKGLISEAKANPGKLNYATVGNGTGTHLSGEMFKLITGTDIVHVPFAGSGPALLALLGKQVEIAVVDTPPAIPYIKDGSVRALAVTTARRASVLPDIPTLAEAGVPGFEFTSWWGVLGPAGLSPAITKRLNEEFIKALAQPEVRTLLASFAADPLGNSPEEFGNILKQDTKKYEKLVQDTKIKIE
jgi:tripartite-type tricarboxylate transporter receptor subunit TctC